MRKFSYGLQYMDTQVLADQQNKYHLCADTGCRLEDLLKVMVDRDRWLRKSGNSVLSAQVDDDDNNDDTGYHTKVKEPTLSYDLALCEMQTASFRV